MTLPSRINVMKVVSYDVEKLVAEMEGQGIKDIDIDKALEYIEAWVQEDFSCGWGHTATTGDLIYQDENGEEL